MESGGVILASSLTSESGERIKGERGEWGVTWEGLFICFFSLLQGAGALFLSWKILSFTLYFYLL